MATASNIGFGARPDGFAAFTWKNKLLACCTKFVSWSWPGAKPWPLCAILNMRFKNFLLLFILILTVEGALALGIGEWSSTTPKGNIIRHDHWTDIITFNFEPSGIKLDSLTNWYFFKSHIVGQYGYRRFFIIDETHQTLKSFDNKLEWLQFIKSDNLNPSIWKRWYSWDWTYSTDDFKFALFIALLIGVFSSGGLICIVYLVRTLRRKLMARRKFIFITSTILILLPLIIVMIDFLLSRYPQSI